MKTTLSILFFLSAFLVNAWAWAGIVLVESEWTSDGVVSKTSHIDARYSRHDSEMGDAKQSFIYNVDGSVVQLNHKAKTYGRTTKEILFANMKRFTDSRRPSNQLNFKLIDLKKDKKIGQWRCHVYRVTVDEQRRAEFCLVPFGTLGFRPAEVKHLMSWSEVLQSPDLMKVQYDDQSVKTIQRAQALGYPAEYVQFAQSGAEIARRTLKSVSRSAMNIDSVRIPGNYEKQI